MSEPRLTVVKPVASRPSLAPVVRVVTEFKFVPKPLRPRSLLAAFGAHVVSPAVDGILSGIDITKLVLDHVSIPRLIEGIDVDEVLAELNLSDMARQVVDDIDLPDMIRTSSSALGTDAVIGLRLHTASADDVIERAIGRVVRRRKAAPPPSTQ
jgi:hypothetical protein